ncbi:MAG: flagellar hook-length control protein FliK [Spirochaetes bacterium]|nr:flagellar hook-length control protein FliK [Spirochaetota bacterium]
MENLKLNDFTQMNLMPEFIGSKSADIILQNSNQGYARENQKSFENALKDRISSEITKQSEQPEQPAVLSEKDNENSKARENPSSHLHGRTADTNSEKPLVKNNSAAEPKKMNSAKSEEKKDKSADADYISAEKLAALNTLIENLKKLLNSKTSKNNEDNIRLVLSGNNNNLQLIIKDFKSKQNGNSDLPGKDDLKKLSSLVEKFKDLKLSAKEKTEIRKIIDNLENHKSELKLDKRSTKAMQHASLSKEVHVGRNEVFSGLNDSHPDSKNTETLITQLSKLNISSESFSSSKDGGDSFDLSDKSPSMFKNIMEASRNMTHGSRTEGSLLFRQQLNEILERSKITVKDNRNSSIIMKLFPEKLGHLNVNMGLENGVLNGKFMVESDEAKQLLQNDLQTLRTALEEAGINVGSFEVNVRNGQHQKDTNEEMNYNNGIYFSDFKEEAVENYRINENDYRSQHLNMVI